MNVWSTVCASGLSGTGAIGSSAPLSSASMSASDCPATGPAAHSTRIARTASMHWPKVSARTATPVSTTAMVRTPGIAATTSRLSSRFGVPLSVGARQTMVGSASLTLRSVVNVF